MKLKILALLLLMGLATSYNNAQTKVETNFIRQIDKTKMQQWVDSVFNNLSPDERIGQLLTVNVEGNDFDSMKNQLVNLIKNQYIGGLIFMKGNVENEVRLTNIAQQAAKVPLLTSIDGEWGLSMRLPNTTRFPKNMMLGAIRNDSLLYEYGKEVARQCRLMGIHVNFAPDMDVNSNPANPVIGIRSYGESVDRVSQLGIMYSKGLEAGNVMSVSKHFPGHGDTSTDSHKTLPLIQHSRARLDSVEIVPFKRYIDAGLAGILTAHLNIPALDNSGIPSSLSKKIVTDLLKTNLGFSGLVFTDGLAMKGVSDEKNMSANAINAGNDVLLGPISPIKEFNALKRAVEDGKISEDVINERCKNILTYKYILGTQNYTEIDINTIFDQLNTPQAEWLNRKLNQKAITLLKNDSDIIPLKELDKKTVAAIAIGASSGNSFHKTLKQYDDVTCFNVPDAASLSRLKSQLSKYNTFIVSVHTNKVLDNATLRNVIGNKKSILVFFTMPYQMSGYSTAINAAEAVIAGYEDTPFAQEYAAQAIFGGNNIDGILPVSVKGLFKAGDGLKTEKNRLSYNLPEEVGIKSEKLAAIAKIAQEGIDKKAYPGCEILVIKDGVVIYNQAFGWFTYDQKHKVTTDDIYDLASVTKATATVPAIMKLYDEKKIGLQNPISKFVPLLRATNKEGITIRQALFHETGLPPFIQYYMPAIDKNSYEGNLISHRSSDTYPAMIDNGSWGRTDYKYNPQLISQVSKTGFTKQIAEGMFVSDTYKDTIIQRIADSKLQSKKSYLYSCLNFMLLKEVVEDVSKTDLNSYLQNNFYTKLGATTTTYNPLTKFEKDNIAPTEKDDFLRKQLLQGYVHDEGAAFLGGISGNAGLFSNANDLAKLYQMMLNLGTYGGEQYLSKETARLFTTMKSANSRRGLGFDKPDPRAGKSSPTSPQAPMSVYGHTGFTGTCFWIDPDNKTIYIFLSNRTYPIRTHKNLMTLDIRSRIQEVIYNAIK